MKLPHLFGILSLLISFICGLAQAASNAQVLGVGNGVYQGSGTLQSQVYPVPDLGFISQRTLGHQTITATTRAYLITNTDSAANQMIRQAVLGPLLNALIQMPIAEATAQLEVVYIDSINFKLIDLKTKAPAGSGFCSEESCTFSANVSNGLELNETWTPSANGFIISGSQNFHGLRSVYRAQMTRAGQ